MMMNQSLLFDQRLWAVFLVGMSLCGILAASIGFAFAAFSCGLGAGVAIAGWINAIYYQHTAAFPPFGR